MKRLMLGTDMTPEQLNYRDSLLELNDQVLEKWPGRTGKDFKRELSSITDKLKLLAIQADFDNEDPLERARTWRFIGNAFFDLGNAEDRDCLLQAVEAFQKSEDISQNLNDPVETMKLNYCLGNTLFRLCNEGDIDKLKEVRRRHAIAVEKAHQGMPEAIETAEQALKETEQVIALLEQGEKLTKQIDEMENSLKAKLDTNETAEQAPKETEQVNALLEQGEKLTKQIDEMENSLKAKSDTNQYDNDEFNPVSLFNVLQQQYQSEKDSGKISGVRARGLDEIMTGIGQLVNNTTKDQSLEEMFKSRESLNNLMIQMGSKIRKPSFEKSVPCTGSRAQRIQNHLVDLKTLVGADSMRMNKAEGDDNAVLNFYKRIARLNTFINNTQNDEQQLIELETDQIRQIVHEVRLYFRRHYITVAFPIWPSAQVIVNPNAVFFSGPENIMDILYDAVEAISLEINSIVYPGANPAEGRWHDIRKANLAIFCLTGDDPQVYYDLGIALTIGTELLLIAKEGTKPHFDVAQDILYYSSEQDLKQWLDNALIDALYGIQNKGEKASSVQSTIDFIKELAEDGEDNQLLNVTLDTLDSMASDPEVLRPVVEMCLNFLPYSQCTLIYPRWTGQYPDQEQTRCFIIMPFRKELNTTRDAIENICHGLGIIPIRGDIAECQEIIQSIWDEISRADYIIVDLSGFNHNVMLELGMADTLGCKTLLIIKNDPKVKPVFSISTRRYHIYGENPCSSIEFDKLITSFLLDNMESGD